MAETTIVLADDHQIVREGFALLCSQNGLRVVGQCSDGRAAFEMIHSLRPDFALLDLQMPLLTGIQVVHKLRAADCPTKLMILSIVRDEGTVQEALQAGADAYLLKDGPSRHLIDAINYVRDGGVYVSPLLGRFPKGQDHRQNDPLATLSQREMEVFSYLVNGMRPKNIAELLKISPKTVDTYRASLMRKLNVHDLVGLVKFAIERNLTTTSSEPVHPPEWQHLPIKEAIQQMWSRSGIPESFEAHLEIETLPREPDPDVKGLLYRAAQEAVSRIVRYSRATRVEASLRIRAGNLVLRFQDNGPGLEASRSGGIGLLRIREEAQALGGILMVESGPVGTTLELTVPFPPAQF